jgi:GT2 family glycosyltransferase
MSTSSSPARVRALPRLTIGITSRERPLALIRCLESLTAVASLAPEVLVFDDGSPVPVVEQLAGHTFAVPYRILRDDRAPGNIVGRNRLVREASAPRVLLLDDDAALLGNGAVERAMTVMDSDPQAAAVAFAQAELDGTRWDAAMQPSPSRETCVITAYIGFAHLLRRDVFLELGGYRESFVFYGEEKDYCLRLVDAGYRTVYLPDALVVHAPDSGGRSKQRYLRYVTRNDCLHALYNEPLGRALFMVPARLVIYFKMRRTLQVSDRWGWAWIARELAANAGSVLRDRRPVSRATVGHWKRLRHHPEPYRVGSR